MSYLCSLMKLIATFSNEDPRRGELVRKIDLLEGENTLLQAQYKEHEFENTRLQIELFNVESMMEPINQLPGAESIENTNMQQMETCINIRYYISQIDFSKIAQFNHIQMEQSYRKEWQQLQEYTVSLLEWHEKMEKRYVVQSYRKVEKSYKEMLKNDEKNQSDMEKFTKQNLSLLREAEEKLNTLVLCTVEGSRISNKLRDSIEQASVLTDLRKQRVELLEILESKQQKTFSSMMPYNNTFKPSISTSAVNTFQYEMPKFPSFNDILKTFNQDLSQTELAPEITMIENTTNIMVKSILRNNSQNNSMEINQSITTKHTKHVHFKMQLEDKVEFRETTDSTLSDCSSGASVDTRVEVPHQSGVKGTKMQNQIETIDLLAPSDGEILVNKQQGPKNPTSKPKVDILECIVIKPSTSNKGNSNSKCAEKNNEIVPPKSFNVVELQENELDVKTSGDNVINPPHNPGPSRKGRHSLKKNFFNEFLNATLPEVTSSDDSSNSSTETSKVSKDFEMLFCEQNQAPDVVQSQDNFKTGPEEVVENNNDTVEKDAVANLNFDRRQDFFFDMNDGSDGADPFAKDTIMDFFS